jgi:uncharacterized protein (TIGR02646 family)
MIPIMKLDEPAGLVKFRHQPAATYEALPSQLKQEIREALVQEQRGLCCYCMGRIRPDSPCMTIEHWQPQSLQPARQVDYANLLASCRAKEHCNHFRENRVLVHNPADPAIAAILEGHLDYLGDGSIESTNAALMSEAEQCLGLNNGRLKSNRQAVLQAFMQAIRPSFPSRRGLERLLSDHLGTTHANALPAYVGVIRYWLRKRLARP